MLRTPILLLPCLVLSACEVSETRFPAQFAKQYCSELKTCDSDVFWETYNTGTPECRGAVADDVDDYAVGSGDAVCMWQQEVANECIRALRDMTCDDVFDRWWFEDCADAWDCVNVVPGGVFQ